MNTLAVVCVAVLVGIAMAQEDGTENCKSGCMFFCDTISKGCVDVPPLVNCAAQKAACSGQCDNSCACFSGCTSQCSSLGASCASANGNMLMSVICKSQVTLCVSSCPVLCAGQAITTNIQTFLQQSLGRLGKSLTMFLPNLAPAA